MLWEAAYAELVFTDTLWPDFGADDLQRRARRVRAPAAPVRRRGERRSARGSLVAVAPVCRPCSAPSGSAAGGSPRVALVGGLLALHELYAMARGLRPLVLARLRGARARRSSACSSADLSGCSAACSRRVLVAFVHLRALAARGRRPRWRRWRRPLLGVVWVGGGLGCLHARARHPRARPARDLHRPDRRLRRRHGRVLRRPGDRPAPHGAGDLARKVVGGVRRRHGRRDGRRVLLALRPGGS